MVCWYVKFRGRFGTIPLRSASDAQESRVAPSLAPCWSSPERRTALMERFLTCTRSSGISKWLVAWSDQRRVFFVCRTFWL